MGNFKKVKLYIESTGYMYTTDENNIEGWDEGIMDEDDCKVVKVEVVEDYELKPQHIRYINSPEMNDKTDDEIEKEILSQSRDKKINLILRK